MDQRCHDARSAAAERMAERDGATVDVEFFRVTPSSRMQASTCDAKASLISTRSICSMVSRALQRFLARGNRSDAHEVGMDTGGGRRHDASHRLEFQLFGFLRGGDQQRRSAIQSGEELPAVTEPSFLNTGRSPARISDEVSARGPSSLSCTNGAPLRWAI